MMEILTQNILWSATIVKFGSRMGRLPKTQYSICHKKLKFHKINVPQ